MTYTIGQDSGCCRCCLARGSQIVGIMRPLRIMPQALGYKAENQLVRNRRLWSGARTFRDGHADQPFTLPLAIRAQRFIQERVVLPRAIGFICGRSTDVCREKLRERHLWGNASQ